MLPETPQCPERLDVRIPEDRDAWWEETAHLFRYYWAAAKTLKGPVLDAACGVGYGTEILRQAGHEAIGLDQSWEAIQHALHAWGDYFVHAPLTPQATAGYKTLVSFETLEHLDAPQYLLKLTPCEELLASVPIVPTRHYNPHHKHDFTLDSFHHLLHATGWRVVEQHLQSHPARINIYTVVRCVRT